MTDQPFTPFSAARTGDLIRSEDHGDAFEVMSAETDTMQATFARRTLTGWYYADDDNVGDLTEAVRLSITGYLADPVMPAARQCFDEGWWVGRAIVAERGFRNRATIDRVSWFRSDLVLIHARSGSTLFSYDPHDDPSGWSVLPEQEVPIMP